MIPDDQMIHQIDAISLLTKNKQRRNHMDFSKGLESLKCFASGAATASYLIDFPFKIIVFSSTVLFFDKNGVIQKSLWNQALFNYRV